jgi:hypothetical protein
VRSALLGFILFEEAVSGEVSDPAVFGGAVRSALLGFILFGGAISGICCVLERDIAGVLIEEYCVSACYKRFQF